jgi:hypothetical protein
MQNIALQKALGTQERTEVHIGFHRLDMCSLKQVYLSEICPILHEFSQIHHVFYGMEKKWVLISFSLQQLFQLKYTIYQQVS